MAEFKDYTKVDNDEVNVIDGEDVEALVANRPHDQAFFNTDWLASILNADRNFTIRGGGTISWNSSTGQLTLSERLYIEFPNERLSGSGGGTRVILNAGTISFGSNHVAALRVRRDADITVTTAVFTSGTGLFASFEAYRDAIEALGASSQKARFEYVLLAARNLTATGNFAGDIILWDGRRIRSGEQLTNFGATDTQYAQQSVFTTLQNTVNQNMNLRLLGGGDLTWDTTSNRLNLGEDLLIVMPSDVTMTIASGDLPIINNDEVYFVSLTRGDNDDIGVAVSKTALSSILKTSSATFILAVRYDDILYLADGTVLQSGSSRPLGSLGAGVKWRYVGYGNGLAALDFSTDGTLIPFGVDPNFQVGGGELLVYVNGILQTPEVDYTEDLGAGKESTSITWLTPAGPPAKAAPEADDLIVAMVGLANPNRGPVGPEGPGITYDPAEYDGTSLTGSNPPEGDVQIRMDADESVELSAGASWISIQAGDFLRKPLLGQLTGGATEGALRVIPHLPSIFWTGDVSTEADRFFLSPGEIPLPIDTNRDEFRVVRSLNVQRVRLSGAAIIDSFSGIIYPAPVYVYGSPSSPRHDAGIDIKISQLPPVALIPLVGAGTSLWLAHPSDSSYIYLGSFVGTGSNGSAPNGLVTFIRSGEVVHLGPTTVEESLATPAANNYQLTTLEAIVPKTALSVLVQARGTVQVAANSITTTGVAFHAGPSDGPSEPGAFPTSLSNDYLLWEENFVNPTGSPVNISKTSPVFEMPIWNPGTSDPELGARIGANFDSLVVRLLGYRESPAHPYRLEVA